ncbi:MAG: ComF family protein [Bacteroidales bacterium]|jgi:ComF family protein
MKYLADLWDDFLSLLFPRICCGCGMQLVRNESVICTECFLAIPRTNYHLIPENPVSQLFWGRCMIEKAAAFSFYTKGSRIRRIIHKLKYDGVREAGVLLGRIYASQLKESGFLSDIDLIIPVPLHPSKKRKRGFNQCDCICDGISEISGIPVDRCSLERASKSDTQTRKSRYDRWLNVEGIFEVGGIEKITGKHLLLVDDVITTGSTIEACANELLKIENVKVSVIALAVAVI